MTKAQTETVKPKYVYSNDLGKQKLCIECQEYYPLDEEFFYFQWVTSKKGIRSKCFTATCKGCYDIRYRPWRLELKRKPIKSNHEANL